MKCVTFMLHGGEYPHIADAFGIVGLNGRPFFDPYPSGNCELGTQERWEWHLFVSMMKGWKPDG